MARRTGHVPEGGHVLIVIQQPAKYSHSVISGALKYWRVTFPLGVGQNRWRQCLPLCEIAIEDGLNFAPDPQQLRLQIGREDAGWVGVVRRDGLVDLRSRLDGPGERDAQDPQRRCESGSYKCPCVLMHPVSLLASGLAIAADFSP